MITTMLTEWTERRDLPERVALREAENLYWMEYWRRNARFWQKQAHSCNRLALRGAGDVFWMRQCDTAWSRWEHAIGQMHAYHAQLTRWARMEAAS